MQYPQTRPPMAGSPFDPMPSSEEPPLVLNEKQAGLLRHLVGQDGGIPADQIDGRTLRVLERNGLIRREGEEVFVTENGRSYFTRSVRRRRRAQFRSITGGSRQDRIEAIREGLRLLHQALPTTGRLRVGDLDTTAGEVMEGLKRFAERLEEGR